MCVQDQGQLLHSPQAAGRRARLGRRAAIRSRERRLLPVRQYIARELTYLNICIHTSNHLTSLAPADYHRFHSPIDGTISDIRDIPGEYYTGAPIASHYRGVRALTRRSQPAGGERARVRRVHGQQARRADHRARGRPARGAGGDRRDARREHRVDAARRGRGAARGGAGALCVWREHGGGAVAQVRDAVGGGWCV